MIVTGAMDTFVSAKLVHKYGLTVSKCLSCIKSRERECQVLAIVDMSNNVLISV